MSDFLFAQPGFFAGVARVWDIGATFDAYNESPSPAQADINATRNDWLAVGADIKAAISAANG